MSNFTDTEEKEALRITRECAKAKKGRRLPNKKITPTTVYTVHEYLTFFSRFRGLGGAILPNRPTQQRHNPAFIVDNLNLNHIDLTNINFIKSTLSEINFQGATLRGVNFRNTKLYNINFTGADLSYANFNRATIHGCSFFNSTLSSTHFNKATILGCDFSYANLSNSEFSNAKMTRVQSITQRHQGTTSNIFTEADLTACRLNYETKTMIEAVLWDRHQYYDPGNIFREHYYQVRGNRHKLWIHTFHPKLKGYKEVMDLIYEKFAQNDDRANKYFREGNTEWTPEIMNLPIKT